MHVNRKPRRRHSEEFKARVMAACSVPGASVAAVAQSFGVNDNLVHQWRRGRGFCVDSRVAAAPALATACTWTSSRWRCRPRCSRVANFLPASSCARARREDPFGTQARHTRSERGVAAVGGGGLRRLAVRAAAMIRIDALWLCTQPLDMRCGAERLMAHVVHAMGSARAHHGYLFANAARPRVKLLVHDGFGVWCAAVRLNAGWFICRARSTARSAAGAADAGAVRCTGGGPALQRVCPR